MRKSALFMLLVAGITLAMSCPVSAKSEMTVSWDKGIRVSSGDGSFKLKLGGQIMNDWAWFNQDAEHVAAFGNFQDGTEFRRARLYVSGTIYDNILFKAQYDFSGAGRGTSREVALKDMYLGVSKIPVLGTVQVGHQKEPFGLEENTSSKYITFMERSLTAAFVPSRNAGIRQSGSYADGRATVSMGLFRDADDGGRDSGDGNYAGTARVTGLPVHDEDNNTLVHLGGAYSLRNPGSAVDYDQRPEAHLASKVIETPDIDTDMVHLFGAEAAMVYGPLSVQGEYMMSMLDAELANDPSFSAFYAYGSFFVTGESRAYKTSSGLFDRVKPETNFREGDGGTGALELAVRYSFLDLNDEMITAGELTDITVGMNWYLNPNTRVMLNYVRSETKDVGDPAMDSGAANIFQTRFQIDF